MKSVNVAELKNRLSAYLTFARNGEEIVIRDREFASRQADSVLRQRCERRRTIAGRGRQDALAKRPTRYSGVMEDSDRPRTIERRSGSGPEGQGRRSVSKSTAFWDSSALVPLCIEESTTNQVRLQLRRFAPVVWWGSVVEIHSAICRLHRERAIDASAKDGALTRLGILSEGWREFFPTIPYEHWRAHCWINILCERQIASNWQPH